MLLPPCSEGVKRGTEGRVDRRRNIPPYGGGLGVRRVPTVRGRRKYISSVRGKGEVFRDKGVDTK